MSLRHPVICMLYTLMHIKYIDASNPLTHFKHTDSNTLKISQDITRYHKISHQIHWRVSKTPCLSHQIHWRVSKTCLYQRHHVLPFTHWLSHIDTHILTHINAICLMSQYVWFDMRHVLNMRQIRHFDVYQTLTHIKFKTWTHTHWLSHIDSHILTHFKHIDAHHTKHIDTHQTHQIRHIDAYQIKHTERGGGLGSRPKNMYGETLGDGVEYHLMKPTPLR